MHERGGGLRGDLLSLPDRILAEISDDGAEDKAVQCRWATMSVMGGAVYVLGRGHVVVVTCGHSESAAPAYKRIQTARVAANTKTCFKPHVRWGRAEAIPVVRLLRSI